MSYLLDTNAVSEPGRDLPDAGFMRWYGAAVDVELFLSAITLGEMRRGVALLPEGARKRVLHGQYIMLARGFSDRILSVDAAVAETWGELSARLKRAGKAIGLADEWIAATALAHALTLVTRNARHFEPCGCELLSPWRG